MIKECLGIVFSWLVNRIAWIVLMIIGALSTLTSPDTSFWLRNPEEKIRADIVKLTPIGSDMDAVINLIASNKKWKIFREGTFKRWAELSDDERRQQTDFFIRIKRINVLLGRWSMDYADATWTLDEDRRVIDVHVRKTMAK